MRDIFSREGHAVSKRVLTRMTNAGPSLVRVADTVPPDKFAPEQEPENVARVATAGAALYLILHEESMG